MFNTPVPPKSELPSPRELLRSTAIAVAVASVLLVTVVLPAEYGIDPTGVGAVLGLKRMGEIKMALAMQAAADAAADAAAAEAEAALRAGIGPSPATSVDAGAAPGAGGAAETKSDLTDIVLQPGEAREFKLVMRKGAAVRYEWWTDGALVGFDTNGAPENPTPGFYHGYGKGEGKDADEGELIAAFDGLHGWFWRNQTRGVVTVTLHVQGDYQEIREIK